MPQLPDKVKNLSVKQLKQFIIRWNNQFPIDRWFRQKYKIPFGSEEHRRASFLNMKIEYLEDLLFFNLEKKRKQEEEDLLDYSVTGNYLKEEELSEEDIDDIFNAIDLDLLNKNKNSEEKDA